MCGGTALTFASFPQAYAALQQDYGNSGRTAELLREECQMLVSENTRRSRPTVLYGILAKTALSQLDEAPEAKGRSAYFQNLVRLLDLYRLDALRRPTPKAVLDRRRTASNCIRREKVEADAVQSALARAHKAIFDQVEKEQVVDQLIMVFSKLAQGRDGEIAAADLQAAKRFLIELARALTDA